MSGHLCGKSDVSCHTHGPCPVHPDMTHDVAVAEGGYDTALDALIREDLPGRAKLDTPEEALERWPEDHAWCAIPFPTKVSRLDGFFEFARTFRLHEIGFRTRRGRAQLHITGPRAASVAKQILEWARAHPALQPAYHQLPQINMALRHARRQQSLLIHCHGM